MLLALMNMLTACACYNYNIAISRYASSGGWKGEVPFHQSFRFWMTIWSSPQYTTVYHSTPQYITVYHSISQYTTVYHNIPQYTTVYHDMVLTIAGEVEDVLQRKKVEPRTPHPLSFHVSHQSCPALQQARVKLLQ